VFSNGIVAGMATTQCCWLTTCNYYSNAVNIQYKAFYYNRWWLFCGILSMTGSGGELQFYVTGGAGVAAAAGRAAALVAWLMVLAVRRLFGLE
jgi:hypothetical protein